MRKYFWIGFALILVAGTAWIGRATWRARANIVSLHVRKAPLAEVIDSLRRQSGKLIVVDTNLDTKITLDLKNVPLSDALQRVARQASALQGIVHAVHTSEQALGELRSAFQAGDDPELRGWTTLAPRLEGPISRPPGKPQMVPMGPGASVGAEGTATEDVLAFDPGPGSDPPNRIQHKGPQEAPMMVMRFQNSDPAGNVRTVTWSPERIVASTNLTGSLPSVEGKSPSRRVAEDLAQIVHARCTTFYVLKQSLVPVDNFMPGPPGLHKFGGPAAKGGTNDVGVMPRDDLEGRIRREKMSQYEELTPEQRVQRARQFQDHEWKR